MYKFHTNAELQNTREGKVMRKALLVFTVLLIMVALTACAPKAGSDGVNGANGLNGSDGSNGADGVTPVESPYAIKSLVIPCAANPMSPDINELNDNRLEVLLRLNNNMIASSFTDGGKTYLRILSPNVYASTGAVYCAFTVHANGTVTRN